MYTPDDLEMDQFFCCRTWDIEVELTVVNLAGEHQPQESQMLCILYLSLLKPGFEAGF